ncbi:efflux RND transporter periplasmic adaptor subunit [Desulfonatronum sp. SC1]|uniref:efflux RND transporter periplasmic adaptor subunit n=1 Tax=Desulfonatronum sp. SC1 TaxID=2109626 RepID=UPI000D3233FB|nr:efflux RND transporter periplasmic adaptor subunit [Desulfonatronum sp. SC1]PTN37895.1 efflux transporter periplasmic adaptor subunit [Desulfonatronum sp. SC1]
MQKTTYFLISFCRLVLLVLLTLVGVALLFGCSSSSGEEPQEASVPRRVNVVIQEIVPQEIRDVVLLPGSAEPWLSVDLAAETAGRVEKLSVREGDHVRVGQVIAQIDVTALGAGMARARSAFELFEDQLRRRERLFLEQIIHEEELDQIRSEKVQAREALRQAEIEYDRGLLRAPSPGRVNTKLVEVGEFVDRGQVVIELVNIDKIKVQVQVPEMDVRFLEVGQPVLVMVDAFQGQEFQGVIDFIAFRGDPATKTFRTQVVMDNPEGKIRPGMIARVLFLRRTIPDALAIPLPSLIDRGGERLVYVEEDGLARARQVEIGVIERDRIQIINGLHPGDRLIVAGHREVDEGTAVVVR